MRRVVLTMVALAGCSVRADWSTGFRCDDGVCPAGQACIDQVCQITAEPMMDAAIRLADATEAPPDAPFIPPDATPLPPNLVVNPGMEHGTDDWYPWQSVLAETAHMAHSGLLALKACKDPTAPTDYMSVYAIPLNDTPVEQGARYVASVWVRASYAAEEAPPPILHAALRENGGAAPYRDENSAGITTLTTDWVELTTELTVIEPDRTYIELIVWPSATPVAEGTCYVVDDAYVYRAE